jgi:hypothetical protein
MWTRHDTDGWFADTGGSRTALKPKPVHSWRLPYSPFLRLVVLAVGAGSGGGEDLAQFLRTRAAG